MTTKTDNGPVLDAPARPSDDWRRRHEIGMVIGGKHSVRDASLVAVRGKSLLFVVPAYRRVALSAICFRQHADLCRRLRRTGIDAQALVIADDGNIAAAEDAGLLTLTRPNRLGAKLNAGYTFAADQGFDYVCPAGSDAWLHPDRFRMLPGPGTILSTRNHVCVDASGSKQGWFRVGYDAGVGSRVMPVALLAACRYRPLANDQSRGCDTATLRALRKTAEPYMIFTDSHPFETVGFQSGVQLTPYRRLVNEFLHEWQEPFAGLTERFPRELVDAVRALYASGPVTGV